ncbi:hypothetical protein HN873_060154 [Arachis hypogaea]
MLPFAAVQVWNVSELRVQNWVWEKEQFFCEIPLATGAADAERGHRRGAAQGTEAEALRRPLLLLLNHAVPVLLRTIRSSKKTKKKREGLNQRIFELCSGSERDNSKGFILYMKLHPIIHWAVIATGLTTFSEPESDPVWHYFNIQLYVGDASKNWKLVQSKGNSRFSLRAIRKSDLAGLYFNREMEGKDWASCSSMMAK